MNTYPFNSVQLLFILCIISSECIGQNSENASTNIPVVSTAPVNYRVNKSNGKTRHGYYSKGYAMTIFGDTNAIGFRANCDVDEDWSGAVADGPTQSSNSFEPKFDCTFDPNKLYGTVIPGRKVGQNHYDGTQKLGVEVGDLTITYKLSTQGKIIDSVVGVIFDRGPQNQPGESSVASCKKLKVTTDNNQFIYIIYPGSNKYLKQVIGTKPGTKKLKRNPTNNDFTEAYRRMLNQTAGSGKDYNAAKKSLLEYLSKLPLIENFDKPTVNEKKQGKLQPPNNNREVNQ